MQEIMLRYVNFMHENWVWVGIFCVLLIALARTKFEMHWLDVVFTVLAFGLWGVFELILVLM